ncbi:LysM peptidoglycan-binding domain-containing protein [Oceanobacillus piezotolerans]|uniref:LysM peptidoglycan-binding domain-containing protein n=1 Tax=Oceanobacillus piezotolerans TaxID=2448030 RepID=A0A498D5Y1_9BACI|nr:SafA/ExsA family spore coat assembly protein [Oceanobacillus piezotolerans]RLL45118.1 LysM peptidoglycan-binding domain-containing protein [Oceanobacillus piezotolerans]
MLNKFKKVAIASVISVSFILPISTLAASSYTVVGGDTMWKIAVKTQTGVSELIQSNPQIKNPNLIYPGQKLNVPSNAEYNVEQEVIRLVNIERANHGLPALKYDWELARVAKHKSQDMHDKGYFSHNSPTYGSPFDMMKNYGINYKSAGENIAKGQKTAQQVVDAWMNSQGHRANILNSSYTHIGVGYVSDGHYWTQMFMKK